ncbi:hypothetical protein RF11_11926 [Thelohanellus kitauei]|uniref:Uncharacterized protein n=1 Tax=Thelohanellus kitauei TaxID=669202 RepID=A0A0C2MG30_THEKT|nr:hypothetical protein RF11_11926 [Thelohanellus kitauei]
MFQLKLLVFCFVGMQEANPIEGLVNPGATLNLAIPWETVQLDKNLNSKDHSSGGSFVDVDLGDPTPNEVDGIRILNLGATSADYFTPASTLPLNEQTSYREKRRFPSSDSEDWGKEVPLPPEATESSDDNSNSPSASSTNQNSESARTNKMMDLFAGVNYQSLPQSYGMGDLDSHNEEIKIEQDEINRRKFHENMRRVYLRNYL